MKGLQIIIRLVFEDLMPLLLLANFAYLTLGALKLARYKKMNALNVQEREDFAKLEQRQTQSILVFLILFSLFFAYWYFLYS